MDASDRNASTSRTDERAVHGALAARAAALVLSVVVFWPIVAGLAAGLEHALIDIRGGLIPSSAVRTILTVSQALVEFFVLVLVVRLAAGEPRAGWRRLTGLRRLALIAFVAASAAGAAASVWYPFKSAGAIATLGSSRLADWAQETTSLAILGLALKTAAGAAGLIYSVARWQSARASIKPPPEPRAPSDR